MITETIRCARDRAYLAGAEWVVARKEAEALAGYPAITDAPMAVAAEARIRYFREPVAIDEFTGNTPSPFAEVL